MDTQTRNMDPQARNADATRTPDTQTPVLRSISPTSGKANSKVTLVGENLDAATAVNFGPNPATDLVKNGSGLTCLVPQGSGNVPVTVTTAQGKSHPIPFAYK